MKKVLMVLILLAFATVCFAASVTTSIGHEKVPAQNSSDNVSIGDVIGNKTDDTSGDSLYSLSYSINNHMHGVCSVYPTLADGVVLTGAAGAWGLGDYVEIVPANTIISDFDINWLQIENSSAADIYEVVLYYGVASTEAGRTRLSRPAGAITNSEASFMSPIIPANSQVVGRVASSSGGGDTTTISIEYHEY